MLIVEIKESVVVMSEFEQEVYYMNLGKSFIDNLDLMREEAKCSSEQEYKAFQYMFDLFHNHGTDTTEISKQVLYRLSSIENIKNPSWILVALWSYWWRQHDKCFWSKKEKETAQVEVEVLS